MIVLTRLNRSHFAVNDDLIERIQESPDTTLFMVDGASHIVTEPMLDVIELIAHSRAHILALASQKSVDIASAISHPVGHAPIETGTK
jgi:flagellar protein FlbD